MMHDIDLSNIAECRKFPLSICRAAPDNPSKLHVFHRYSDWNKFIAGLSLNKQIPQVISTKYDRAQALYLMAWIRNDVIRLGELAACATLELALKDRYWCEFQNKRKELQKKDKKSVPKYMIHSSNSFLSAGLRFMVDYAGLNDEKLQIYNKSGGVVIANLFSDDKDRKDNLVGFRNSLAHGDPFDGIPIGSFLEIVRDLIEYMYRDR